MAVDIGGVAVVVIEVPACNELALQVGMGGVDAGIQYGNGDAGSDGQVPRRRRVDGLKVPFAPVIRVVGSEI